MRVILLRSDIMFRIVVFDLQVLGADKITLNKGKSQHICVGFFVNFIKENKTIFYHGA